MAKEKPRFPRFGEEDWGGRLVERIKYGERRAAIVGIAGAIVASVAVNLLVWLL